LDVLGLKLRWNPDANSLISCSFFSGFVSHERRQLIGQVVSRRSPKEIVSNCCSLAWNGRESHIFQGRIPHPSWEMRRMLEFTISPQPYREALAVHCWEGNAGGDVFFNRNGSKACLPVLSPVETWRRDAVYSTRPVAAPRNPCAFRRSGLLARSLTCSSTAGTASHPTYPNSRLPVLPPLSALIPNRDHEPICEGITERLNIALCSSRIAWGLSRCPCVPV